MSNFIRFFLAIIFSIVTIAVIALFIFDPNILKPRIEALAKQQHIALTLDGDLSWALWPSIGIEINQLHLAPASQPTASIVQLQQAQLFFALKPLFKGEFNVHQILIKGAAINLRVDKNGNANWAELLKSTTKTTLKSTETSSEQAPPLQLAIEKISLIDSALAFQDQQSGQQINADNIQLTVNNFNTTGTAFSMQASMDAALSNRKETTKKPLPLSIVLTQTVQLGASMDSITLSDGELQLTIKRQPVTAVSSLFSLQATDLNNTENTLPQLQGNINVLPFNLKNLLTALDISVDTSENYALKVLALNTTFNSRDKKIDFNPLKITLDKTQLQGTATLVDIETANIAIDLQGDHINLDHYMAKTASSSTQKSAAASTTTTPLASANDSSGDEAIIPLNTLQAVKASGKLAFQQLTFNQLRLENMAISATANNGLLTLNNASANAYQGTLAAKGSLDARGDSAVIQFQSTIKQLQLEPLLRVLAPEQQLDLSGAINLDAQGKTRGLSSNQLFDGLTSEINFSGAQVRLAPLNIEQEFCQLVALLNKTSEPTTPDTTKEWAQFTQMQALDGTINIAKRVISINSFDASIEHLTLATKGSIDLLANRYDLRLPLTLRASDNKQQTDAVAVSSPQGCKISNNYWLNRSLSLLRCQGSLLELNPVTDCRPDQQALADLGKDYAAYKLRQKHGDKIEAAEQKVDKEKQRLYKKLDDKLGTEGSQATKDLLKSILKK